MRAVVVDEGPRRAADDLCGVNLTLLVRLVVAGIEDGAAVGPDLTRADAASYAGQDPPYTTTQLIGRVLTRLTRVGLMEPTQPTVLDR